MTVKRALSAELVVVDGKAQDWVQLFEVGVWKGHPQAQIEITPKMLEEFKANFESDGSDLVVQLGHDPSGNAPAMGWIRRGGGLETRAGGRELWARIDWTDDARPAIDAKKYRYVSPSWMPETLDRVTKKPAGARLMHVAVTNTPFFTELPPIRASREGEGAMDKVIEKLRGLLGLAADANEAAILPKLGALEGELVASRDGRKRLCATLGLGADADGAAIEASVGALKRAPAAAPAGADMVPRAHYDAVLKRVEALEATGSKGVIEGALKAHKLTAAMVPWAEAYAKSDPEGFAKFLETAPAVVPVTDLKVLRGGASGAGSGGDEARKLIAAYRETHKASYEAALLAVSKDRPELFNPQQRKE